MVDAEAGCRHPLEVRSDTTLWPPTNQAAATEPSRRVRMVCGACGVNVVLHICPPTSGNHLVAILRRGVEHAPR